MALRLARKLERGCCTFARYLPLAFVYGLTSWACWVIVRIGRETTRSSWIGATSSAVGVALYAMLNWSYTTAVFTDPGSTTNTDGYGLLPTDNQNARALSALTVKSNGAIRFCKKCQARKPDRAHHCSTCRRCVLKMDHHCPWLATCIGLRNYKPFLLFLIYSSLFSLYAFAVSSCWFWAEVMTDTQYLDSLMPVNFIMLAVMSGIIGIVVAIFTAWHIVLSCRGQTTIESLEKTRYLTTMRKTFRQAYTSAAGTALHGVTRQLVGVGIGIGMHATNVLPGVTRPDEGDEAARTLLGDEQHPQHPPQMSMQELERHQARKRYEEYLDEQDSDKLPSAFDLGWKRNLLHLLGPHPILWPLPICNTTGDGWQWEPSVKWVAERDRLHAERERQRMREINAGWGFGSDDPPAPAPAPVSTTNPNTNPAAAAAADASGTAHARRVPSKADRILGRDPNLYADGSQDVPMRRLSPKGRTLEDELDTTTDDDDDLPLSRYLSKKQPSLVAANGREWGRGGASGMLRQTSPPSARSPHNTRLASPSLHTSDDDVD